MLRSLTAVVLLIGSTITVATQTPAERDIAARYAPIFHQALGDHPRGDYITNFNFDGDWDGTNNWRNAENEKFRMLGYVYYSVAETVTHYFIHYAVFHARDYKGGDQKGVIYSDLLRMGAKVLSKGEDPKGLLAEAAIAHENDMEGALIVVDKGTGRVAFLETLHHNRFSRYSPEATDGPSDGFFKLTGDRVDLYIEPKGHGIEAWGSEREKPERGWLTYAYSGKAGDPEGSANGKVNYDLLPIATTLWPKARSTARNATFAQFRDFGTLSIRVLDGATPKVKKVVLGTIAAAFDGKVGGVNMARPPWGWFSNDHREDRPGAWFFDPAAIVKRDYSLTDAFSTVYVRLPFWAGK